MRPINKSTFLQIYASVLDQKGLNSECKNEVCELNSF
jgi:hypothetical protein